MHCFNFCLLLKYGTRKYFITILTNISVRLYRTMYFEVSATSSATCWFAARRSTEANGRGSWQLPYYGLWRLVYSRPTEHHSDPITNHPGSQSLQLCCMNAKTVQILSCGYKHLNISFEDISLIKLYSLLYKGISWSFLDLY